MLSDQNAVFFGTTAWKLGGSLVSLIVLVLIARYVFGGIGIIKGKKKLQG